jgi:hypothetical protein
MNRTVHPREVDALKARVGPAIAAAADLRSPEAEALTEQWSTYIARRVSWATAPADLEQGRDLEARLARLQAPAPRFEPRPVAVGTIAGFWTVGELHDLLAAKAYEVTQINVAANACAPAWAAADPTGYGQWAGSLYDANQAFAAAQKNAQGMLDLVPRPMWSFTPAGSAWDQVIAGSRTFSDLYRRMLQEGRCPPADFSALQQPTASDLDLKAFRVTDVATKAIEGVASSAKAAVSSRGNWFALGLLVALGAVVVLKGAR